MHERPQLVLTKSFSWQDRTFCSDEMCYESNPRCHANNSLLVSRRISKNRHFKRIVGTYGDMDYQESIVFFIVAGCQLSKLHSCFGYRSMSAKVPFQPFVTFDCANIPEPSRKHISVDRFVVG